MPSDLVVWGIEPAVLASGVRLSETVAANLEELVEKVVTELKDWGMKIDSKKERVLR
jgi:biotin operon repressor